MAGRALQIWEGVKQRQGVGAPHQTLGRGKAVDENIVQVVPHGQRQGGILFQRGRTFKIRRSIACYRQLHHLDIRFCRQQQLRQKHGRGILRGNKSQVHGVGLLAVVLHFYVGAVGEAVINDFVRAGLLLQAAHLGVGVGGSARQVGVFAHAFQRHFSAELPHQVGHQRFGRGIGNGQRQAVAQLQRRVAGHRHGGGGVVQRTQPRKHRVADALPHLGGAAFGQRHVGDGHFQAALPLDV